MEQSVTPLAIEQAYKSPERRAVARGASMRSAQALIQEHS